MQTECPHCNTQFRLTDEQINTAHGKVRCGLCNEIFQAIEIDSENKPSFAADIEKALTTPDDPLFEGEENKLIPDEFRAPEFEHYSMTAGVAWAFAIIFLASSLVVEYTWFHRNELITQAAFKPAVTRLCEITGCELATIKDTEQIEMISRNVYTHPNVKKALMVSVTMVNHASHAQPYPDVKIDFSDIRGDTVATRRFQPDEYLQIQAENLSLLQPGNPITFALELQDPGKQAMTYEFSFL